MRLIAILALLPAVACGPPPLTDVIVEAVEVRDFALFTTTLVVNGDFGLATLVILDENGTEHVVETDVRGRGAGFGAEVTWGPIGTALIDIEGVERPITGENVLGPYFGVRADTAVGVALQAGAHISVEGIRFYFADVGIGLGSLYGVDAMWFEVKEQE